ncbi:YdeI/OmpD-associated family protein [Pedobacter frigiditerrae]|uniref:YdeI/OmpD-associated family protein n=1 Tax=Pedobacter frigiditerrae TaxID=2530452 RepID=UPI00292DEE0F|nr:YdeI/OmpD-associated family protein [Pedobacter frigiditerrae]
MKHHFEAKIYKIGINWAVDVPADITAQLKPEKGYIRIKGQINDFDFIQTLVPVKNSLYRLFVNLIMMKGGKTALGEVASFAIEQNEVELVKMYAMPKILSSILEKEKLNDDFNALSEARKKDVLKYLSFIKTEETMMKNINKLIEQLKNKDKNARIP